MKAYPTVITITRVVCINFRSTALMLLLITATLFGYSQSLDYQHAGRECFTLLHPRNAASSNPIPVKLGSFNAAKKGEMKVSLGWTTLEEKNASHFVVERSYDGRTFDEAALVFAYGDSKELKRYAFTDELRKKQPTAIYYRLRIVDMDGKTERSTLLVIGKAD